MAFAVKNHVLYKDGHPVAQALTPNLGGALKPSLLVMHYTASQSAKSAISWLCNPIAKASAHLVVDLDGTATQLAPFNRVAWHAGKSLWKRRANCNAFSIGVEMTNAGPLTKRANGKFADAYGKSVAPSEVAMLAHKLDKGAEKPWMAYPAAQIAAAVEIAQAIVAAYGIDEIAGHDDIAPTRKRDPGPAFGMESFVSRVFGRK
ncbi:N-acetylmuramoyl-L-alanine amidase [Methylocystis sp. 9N]|uniref:N-acetylmuramoyl-L-alanine amidase n=1 Tax=Methylocystis borbori TaxID=3118750 RepID=A0ABU7XKP0_9HYPH